MPALGAGVAGFSSCCPLRSARESDLEGVRSVLENIRIAGD
jgi:hypothetical protein